LYFRLNFAGGVAFAFGLILMIISLAVSLWEIQISIKALDLHLKNMED
jgi:hypothetical protein